MRHITISMVLPLHSIPRLHTAAQQTATTSQQTATEAANPANTAEVGGGPDTVTNCPGAQNGRIAIFKGSAPPSITICNSGIYEAKPYGTGAIGILNPNPIAALDVNGDINTSLCYQIGESTVLSISEVPRMQQLISRRGSGSQQHCGAGVTIPSPAARLATQHRWPWTTRFTAISAGDRRRWTSTAQATTIRSWIRGWCFQFQRRRITRLFGRCCWQLATARILETTTPLLVCCWLGNTTGSSQHLSRVLAG